LKGRDLKEKKRVPRDPLGERGDLIDGEIRRRGGKYQLFRASVKGGRFKHKGESYQGGEKE